MNIRWTRATSPGTVSVRCFVCSKMRPLRSMFIDPDGPSFRFSTHTGITWRDYYCEPCKQAKEGKASE